MDDLALESGYTSKREGQKKTKDGNPFYYQDIISTVGYLNNTIFSKFNIPAKIEQDTEDLNRLILVFNNQD